MSEWKMGAAESRFADIIWNRKPIASGELAKLALDELEWKKTTAFTVLKRLCDRGLFQNKGGMVTSLVSRDTFYANNSRQYVRETFGGSLPAFLAAFGSSQKLSPEEVAQLKRLIDEMGR